MPSPYLHNAPSIEPDCASDERGYQRIRVRQDTLANWLKNDPVLASGEFGYVIGNTQPGEVLKIGDGTVRWSNLPWLLSGGAGSGDGECGHIVSIVEPPPAGEVGALWINPAEMVGTTTVTDVLAAIRGQVIAPKAIDLDGPNTLYIAQDAEGSVKLSLRSDSTKGSRLDNYFATEDWVLAQFGATTPTSSFSNANPPAYAGQPVVEQDNGLPIGLSPDGMEIHQPYLVGGVPVLIGGKRYLLPVIEAPATLPPDSSTPLFTYADAPVTQQLDGTIIGLNADGTEITQPLMVGGVSVVLGGKRYLLPVISE